MILSHRINFLNKELAAEIFAAADGIEFDIRDSGGVILVQHDPFVDGQPFAEFIQFCDPAKFYIVNVKSEGIETAAIQLLEAKGIKRFFLLDCSIPAIVRLGRTGERRIAVRFSEYESIETVLALRPFAEWVWVDVFSRLPLTKAVEEQLRAAGFSLCLVSPELQGQTEKIDEYISALTKAEISIDAVCCKRFAALTWSRFFAPSPSPTIESH